jgi:probable HAF family extracellular repeat protein
VVGVVLASVGVGSHGAAAAPGDFSVMEIVVPGSTNVIAHDVNAAGNVVGEFSDAEGVHGFLYDGAGLHDLGAALPRFVPRAINDGGEMAGQLQLMVDDQLVTHAATKTLSGPVRDLGTIDGDHSEAFDINNRGEVVGGSTRAFLWRNGTMTAIGPSEGNPVAVAINDAGEVAITDDRGDFGHSRAFRYANGVTTTLAEPEGAQGAFASGINAGGDVSGWVDRYYGTLVTGTPYRWLGDTPDELAPLGRTSDINCHGDVVGTRREDLSSPRVPVVWQGSEAVDLSSGLPSADSTSPAAINDLGVIVVNQFDAGEERAYVLTPQSPSTPCEVERDGKATLVFVPGVAGSSLVTGGPPDCSDSRDQLWPDVVGEGVWNIVSHDIDQLAVAADGVTSAGPVCATAVIDEYPSPIGFDIYKGFRERFENLIGNDPDDVLSQLVLFPYDWRLGVDRAAETLADELQSHCFDPGPVWVAAHSTGGLVSKVALRKLRQRGTSPETCFAGGGVVFLATPHAGAPKAIGSAVDPDEFFGSFFEKLLSNGDAFARVANNWLTVWELMPRRDDPDVAPEHPEAREAWFDDPSDGRGDNNVAGDPLNFSLDLKAAQTHPSHDDLAGTVGALPVYNVFGVGEETPGSYAPGNCNAYALASRTGPVLRRYEDLEDQVELDATVQGDGTVPGWSAIWPGGGLASATQYAIATEHKKVATADPVLDLIQEVVQGEPPSGAGLLPGNEGIQLALANRSSLTLKTCSPVAVRVEVGAAATGFLPDGHIGEEIPGSLVSFSSDGRGFASTAIVVPEDSLNAPPIASLEAIDDGPVGLWIDTPDGGVRTLLFDVERGDRATVLQQAGGWRVLLDRRGDGSVDATFEENGPTVLIKPVLPAGPEVTLETDGTSGNAGPLSYTWEVVDGQGTIQPNGGGETATLTRSGAAPVRVRVTVTNDQGQVADDEAIVAAAAASIPAAADTYLRSGAPDTNEGAAPFLQVRASGDNRALVRFDQAALQSLVGSGTVLSATLTFEITDNGDNWGATGRTISAYRVTSAWAEGNGFNSQGTPPTRGTGPGATWRCAIDAQISNQARDCSGTTAWEMGKPDQPSLHPWSEPATASALITNGQTGAVTFDVTADVRAFLAGTAANHGWIIKKDLEGQPGHLHLGSREADRPPTLTLEIRPS